MKLSTIQQDWADTFELSDSLVEDAAEATNYSTGTGAEPFNGIICPDCWSNPCVCATDSVGEQTETPDEKSAAKNIFELRVFRCFQLWIFCDEVQCLESRQFQQFDIAQ